MRYLFADCVSRGRLRVGLEGRIYLEAGDFEWVAERLRELYGRVERGQLKP